MRRTMRLGLACLLLAGSMTSLTSAKAVMIRPSSIGQRVATADCVIVGKVIGFGDKTVSANKVEYQIAIVKVETNILGAKDTKEVRVGFIPLMRVPTPGRPVPIRRRPGIILTLNQEACLFLSKHSEADFYTAPVYFSVINKQGNDNFNKEVDEAKRCAQLLANPKAGLESKSKDDRLLTAGLLISRYRISKGGKPKTAPIDAEQSKRLLRILAEADWTARPTGLGAYQMTPQFLFSLLGVTAKDGWTPPKDLKQFPEAAKKWLTENVETYRIQRLVYEKAEKEKSDK